MAITNDNKNICCLACENLKMFIGFNYYKGSH